MHIYNDDDDKCYSELLLRAAVQRKIVKMMQNCLKCLISKKVLRKEVKYNLLFHYKFKQGSNSSGILKFQKRDPRTRISKYKLNNLPNSPYLLPNLTGRSPRDYFFTVISNILQSISVTWATRVQVSLPPSTKRRVD